MVTKEKTSRGCLLLLLLRARYHPVNPMKTNGTMKASNKGINSRKKDRLVKKLMINPKFKLKGKSQNTMIKLFAINIAAKNVNMQTEIKIKRRVSVLIKDAHI